MAAVYISRAHLLPIDNKLRKRSSPRHLQAKTLRVALPPPALATLPGLGPTLPPVSVLRSTLATAGLTGLERVTKGTAIWQETIVRLDTVPTLPILRARIVHASAGLLMALWEVPLGCTTVAVHLMEARLEAAATTIVARAVSNPTTRARAGTYRWAGTDGHFCVCVRACGKPCLLWTES